MYRSIGDQVRHAGRGRLTPGLTTLLAGVVVLGMTGCSGPDGEPGRQGRSGADAPADGRGVYARACFACHENGLVGAPRIGDRDAWASRISRGREILVEHAINGFQGASGVMPPKGGHRYLGDGEIAAAVDFMIDRAR